ncbi:hypothetical protein SRHO_G00245480 [Serrasalmus rhombeus]
MPNYMLSAPIVCGEGFVVRAACLLGASWARQQETKGGAWLAKGIGDVRLSSEPQGDFTFSDTVSARMNRPSPNTACSREEERPSAHRSDGEVAADFET